MALKFIFGCFNDASKPEASPSSLCCWCKVGMPKDLSMPKLKMSGFGIRKGLLVDKVPTKKMEDVMMPQSVLREPRTQWGGGRKRAGQEVGARKGGKSPYLFFPPTS